MPEPTKTRATLRREVCKELGMPFFQRYPAGYLEMDASSTVSKIIDSALTQKQGFWNGSWHFNVGTGEVSKIRAFDSVGNFYQLEVPLASSPSSGDDYEILTGWSPIDVHQAINRAIESVQRVYFDTVTDETQVLKEDILEYTISSLTKVPWIVTKVFIEDKTARRGTAQSSTGTTIVVENSGVTTDVNTNWYISIYDGTGAGQLRQVVSVSGAEITVAAWTTNPDTTSKYCLWDSTEQLKPWRLMEGIAVDSKEWPATLYINHRFSSLYGMRIRIEYIAYPSSLTTDADTTIVPAEYIINKAASILYGKRLRDNKVDRETYYAEHRRYEELAEDFKMKHRPQLPDIKIKAHMQTEFYREDDPLGWWRRW